jgi:hypothetical protein
MLGVNDMAPLGRSNCVGMLLDRAGSRIIKTPFGSMMISVLLLSLSCSHCDAVVSIDLSRNQTTTPESLIDYCE